MTDHPYSQQIHDKILNDWKDIPFDEWKMVDGGFISHPSVNYEIWTNGYSSVTPKEYSLSRNITYDHSQNLFDKLIKNKQEEKNNKESELAAKQFLGLQ